MTPADGSRKFWFFFAPSLPSRIVTDHPAQARSSVPRRVALAASLLVGLNACGDDFAEFDWFDTPDTTVIYSLQVPLDPQLGSGFNFYDRSLIQVEAPGATLRALAEAGLRTRTGTSRSTRKAARWCCCRLVLSASRGAPALPVWARCHSRISPKLPATRCFTS